LRRVRILSRSFFFHYYGCFFILLLFFSRFTFCMCEPDQFYYKNVMNLRRYNVYILLLYIYLCYYIIIFCYCEKKQNFATVCKSAAAMVAVSNYRRKFQTCIIIYARTRYITVSRQNVIGDFERDRLRSSVPSQYIYYYYYIAGSRSPLYIYIYVCMCV